MAHFWNIILTSIVTHGNSDKIRRDKSCHYWRAYLYPWNTTCFLPRGQIQRTERCYLTLVGQRKCGQNYSPS